MSLAIVTDSTCDLPAETCQQYGIHTVPLSVLFGGQTYRDGLDIQVPQLFEGVKQGQKIPTTSQPSPVSFAETYHRALQHADQVLSIHISGQLSGTVGSARLAAQEFGERVRVFDGQSATAGTGLQVLRAAQRAREGRSAEEIVTELEALLPLSEIRFTVDTLDYLRINGRIGGGAALLGGLLNIKPILVVKHGRVESGGRVRGGKKAIADITEHILSYTQKFPGARIVLMSTPGGEEARQEVRRAIAGARFEDMGDLGIGTVIASHVGPGTFGVIAEPPYL